MASPKPPSLTARTWQPAEFGELRRSHGDAFVAGSAETLSRCAQHGVPVRLARMRGGLRPYPMAPLPPERPRRSAEEDAHRAKRAVAWMNTAVRARIGITRRTHGTRESRGSSAPVRTRGSRRGASTRTSSRGDDPGPTAADDDWPSRPPERLLSDVELHLRHAGSSGVERAWFEAQVAGMGHAVERVRAAIALVISLGIARSGVGDCDVPVIYSVRGGRAR